MDETEFQSFVANLFRVPVGTLTRESAYEATPAWDSVMHLRLVQEIGERYGVEIPFEKVPVLLTLGVLFDYVRSHRPTGGAR